MLIFQGLPGKSREPKKDAKPATKPNILTEGGPEAQTPRGLRRPRDTPEAPAPGGPQRPLKPFCEGGVVTGSVPAFWERASRGVTGRQRPRRPSEVPGGPPEAPGGRPCPRSLEAPKQKRKKKEGVEEEARRHAEGCGGSRKLSRLLEAPGGHRRPSKVPKFCQQSGKSLQKKKHPVRPDPGSKPGREGGEWEFRALARNPKRYKVGWMPA